jgi:hypothetical protein
VTSRILVTGSRNWTDRRIIYHALRWGLETFGPDTVVVHGGAAGADTICREIGRQLGMPDELHTPRWRPNGIFNPVAGFDRNARMVALGADRAFYFGLFCSDGKCRRQEQHLTHGTEDCVKRIQDAGIPLWGWTL